MRKTNKVSKKLLFIVGALLIIGGGGVYMLWGRNSDPKPASEGNVHNIGKADTFTTESDGQPVEAPTNVDPASIKPYELITENETFKIRKLNNEYTITLYAIINRPDQADSYRDQLKRYKSDALQYLTDHGINVSKVTIHYDPDEAKDL